VNFHNVINNPPDDLLNKWEWNENDLPEIHEQKIFSLKENKNFSFSDIILKLISNPSIASKRWIYKQYDSQVQANTVFKPGQSDAAVVRLREQNKKNKSKVFSGVAASVDCNSRWVALDPFRGSIAAVAESARNVSCVGAEPVAITNNLNFSSPENVIGYWQLASSCNGIAEACKALETPVTGGNVSLYNESKNKDNLITPINPTPVIGMVGKLDNVEKAISSEWKNIEDQIWLIGSSKSEIKIAASSYLEYFHGEITGRPPKIDLLDEKFCQSFLRNAILNSLVLSSHDISDGGLAIALAESCILSAMGATIELEKDVNRVDNLLFAEGGSRIIFSISKMKQNEWFNYLKQTQINFPSSVYVKKIGYVSSDKLKIKINEKNICNIRVEELTEKFNNSISDYF
ncbi:AIR synthase related protein, partial [Prochlorococcus sp. AH-736-E19]|nr:AIR synthase related protein [Prochlorococcus sp. AH-736-E19]